LFRQAYETEIQPVKDRLVRSRRVYEEAVKEALTIMWEASDRLCGKRLKAILPEMVEVMERHGHLSLDPEVRNQVLRISAATIDRLLKPIRNRAQSRRKQRRTTKASQKILVRTFAD